MFPLYFVFRAVRSCLCSILEVLFGVRSLYFCIGFMRVHSQCIIVESLLKCEIFESSSETLLLVTCFIACNCFLVLQGAAEPSVVLLKRRLLLLVMSSLCV